MHGPGAPADRHPQENLSMETHYSGTIIDN